MSVFAYVHTLVPNTAGRSAGNTVRFWCSTEAELPSEDVIDGDRALCLDTGTRRLRVGGVWTIVSEINFPSPPVMLMDGGEQGEGIWPVPGPRGAEGTAASGGGGTTIFLHEDAAAAEAWPTPFNTPPVAAPAGTFAITTIEQNLGSVPAVRGTFIVSNGAVTPASKIVISQAPGPYTGKGTLADESDMDVLRCVAVPGSGQFTVRWEVLGHVAMRPVAAEGRNTAGVGTAVNAADAPMDRFEPIRIGKVKGNFKFHYTVG